MKLPFPGRLLALAVISSRLALPLSAAHAEDKPKVALVMKSLANEFFRTMEDGARDYQKAHASEST
jgi:ribose transport system substrate-binding protein